MRNEPARQADQPPGAYDDERGREPAPDEGRQAGGLDDPARCIHGYRRNEGHDGQGSRVDDSLEHHRAERLDRIQLLAPLSPESTIAKFLDRSGPGIQQMAYRVSDLDALSDQLRGQGVRLVYDAPRRGTANSRINFIHPKDAGGILVELVEPAASPAH